MTTDASAILTACDRVLGEIGRRDHMFGWLRAPDAEMTGWLAVDAYYPSHRLVVLCRPREAQEARLCAERIPAHGLRLLELAPDEMPDDPQGLKAALENRIAALAPVERPSGQLQGRERTLARPPSLLPQPVARPLAARPVGEARAAATARGARFLARDWSLPRATMPLPRAAVARPAMPGRGAAVGRQPFPARGAGVAARGGSVTPQVSSRRLQARERPAVARPGRSAAALRGRSAMALRAGSAMALRQRSAMALRERSTAPLRARSAAPLEAPGVLVGLALIAVLCAEMYLGVARLGLGRGHVVLAFGIALDCCARALGTLAAQRARRPDWVWACAILGSPAVAAFSVYGGEGEVPPEPAPLAGLVSLFACAAVALAVLAGQV